ncbi:unnamed protein product [Adineta ricciae]|uniref:Uncharacterized protein n=1 Tax=Adineta ricciae TaxID=249248 RepID=A0A814TXT0_ADIRI|nr:unnamed protein product [Adineta ricciae]
MGSTNEHATYILSFYVNKGTHPPTENDQFIKFGFYVINNDNYVCTLSNVPVTIRLPAVCVIIKVKNYDQQTSEWMRQK